MCSREPRACRENPRLNLRIYYTAQIRVLLAASFRELIAQLNIAMSPMSIENLD